MSIEKKVIHGVKWAAFANVLQQLVSLVGLVVFAKLLSPHDFGTFSIIMIFVGFLAIFSDMGTSAALIHIKKPSDNLLSSVFFLNIIVGIVLTFSLTFVSKPIARYFDNPDLEELLYVVSFSFIILSFGIVQKTIFQKNMNFKHLTYIDSSAIFIGLAAGVVAAYSGMGVHSLVIQLLVGSTVNVLSLWYYSSWQPRLYFSIKEIGLIWKYTANLSVFSIINYFSKNADNFLIGKYLSSSALGVYSLAYRIMLYPLQNISTTITRVLFPALSTFQDDNQKFKKAYLKVIFFIALITFPIMTGLMAIAVPLVEAVFFDKWEGLATLLIILAPSGLLRSVYSTVGIIFMAKGNTNLQLKLGTANAILTVVGFAVGLRWGVNGVALAYLVVNVLMLYPTFKISWKQIGLCVGEGISVLLPVLMMSIVMGVFTYYFGYWLEGFVDNVFLRLFLMILIGATMYLLMIQLRYGNLKSLIGSIKK